MNDNKILKLISTLPEPPLIHTLSNGESSLPSPTSPNFQTQGSSIKLVEILKRPSEIRISDNERLQLYTHLLSLTRTDLKELQLRVRNAGSIPKLVDIKVDYYGIVLHHKVGLQTYEVYTN